MDKIYINNSSIVSTFGVGLSLNWQALCTGIPRFRSFSGVPVAALPPEVEVSASKISSKIGFKNYDQTSLIGIAAVNSAIEGLTLDLEQVAVIMGSSRGCSQSLEKGYESFFKTSKVSPQTSPITTAGSISSAIARYIGSSAANMTVSSACNSGLQAIGVASALIRSGAADSAVAGGVEVGNTPFTREILKSAKVISVISSSEEDVFPAKPFSEQRTGIALGEGAGVVVLSKKKTSNCVELLAYASATESGSLAGARSDGRSIYLAISKALDYAGINPEDIGLVVGHGTGTKKGDDAELVAYRRLFESGLPPLALHKWLFGHQLGASAAVSVCLATEHLKHGFVPRHPYYKTQDLPIGRVQTLEPSKPCLIVSSGFGGTAAALIILPVNS